jgi:glutathione S-transferase
MTDLQTSIELIGMMDSPFVRRVAIALSCYELSYTLNPLSVYNKPELLAAINPLLTVPVLRSGEVQLLDSRHILQWIDAKIDDAWLQKFDASLHANIMAASDVLALKAGELYREKAWRESPWRCPQAISRITTQLAAALALIESSSLVKQASMHHASIAIATSYRFAKEVGIALEVSLPDTPRLAAYCATLEAMPHFIKCN